MKSIVKMFPSIGLFLTLLSLGGATSVTSDCTLIDKDHFYDLSALAERDYWPSEEKIKYKNFNLNFYISVCHPLRNVPSQCSDSTAGVCVEQLGKNESLTDQERFMKVLTTNAGMITPQSLKLTNQGWLEYVYTNGTPCEYHGRDSSYTTYLNILCPTNGHEESAGPVLMSNSMCELTFAWLSLAACPVRYNEKKVTTCVDKFIDSNDQLNLHALHSKTYYESPSSNRHFQVNICGAIEAGPCNGTNATVCDVTDPSHPVVISDTTDIQVMWHGPYFTLHYNKEGNNVTAKEQKEVTIQFLCDREAHDTTIHFLSSNDTHIRFAARTSTVCTPQTHECIIKDKKGHVYDLRPLHKESENWEVLDRRVDHRDVLYHMNLCGPVNDVGYFACPLGNIGACQTSMNRETAYNLGWITSNPVINDDGTITVLYTGGDSCHDGKHTRSTRLTLVCDKFEHEPMFLEETSTCEYVFSWLTPIACPKHVIESNTCQIQDPLFGFTYDLSSLRNIVNDYNTSDGTHDFFVNLCGPVVGDYGGTLPANTSVVMVGESKKYQGGGTSPAQLIFNDGTLTMDLRHGTHCVDNDTHSSQIIFLCDHDSEDANSGLSVFRHESSCKFNFLWRTKYACPPHTVIDCSVTSADGFRYDLNPLSMSNINHEDMTANHDEKYVLNVCRSVVHSKIARCAYDAAACLIDESHKNDSVNMGVINKGPYLENGRLKLLYVNGDKCNDNQRYSTEIFFECDPFNYYPYPNFISKESCKFIFEWKTKFACPERIELTNFGNCSVKDVFTNYKFDLSPLKKASGYTVSHENVTLLLNVCDVVTHPKCASGSSGSCVQRTPEQDFKSAGEANAQLMSTPGTLSLRYRDGSPCANGLNSTTLISFFCGAEDSQEGPVLVAYDTDSCTFFVNWHTELACDSRIACIARGYDRSVDLRPLIKHGYDNYQLSVPSSNTSDSPNTKFFLNVCRPLNHVTGTTCEAGAGACLVKEVTNGSSNALSLGKPLMAPHHGSDDSALLLYTMGSMCVEVPGLKYTTRIDFKCDRTAGLGSPVFKALTHDCQYQLEWLTELACDPLPPTTETDATPVCHVRHDQAKANIDLSPLYRTNGYRVPFGGKIYYVNVCGSACNGSSGVCTNTGESYGLSDISQFKWDLGLLKLIYYGGDSCNSLSGKKTSRIFFECDLAAGHGHPEADELMEDIFCMAIFNWKTNLTCLESVYGSSTTTTTTTTTTTPVPVPVTTKPNSTDAGAAASRNKKDAATGVDGEGGGLSTTAAVVVTLMVLTAVVAGVVWAVRSGKANRLINRAKMATATPRYSSRNGMTLLDDTL